MLRFLLVLSLASAATISVARAQVSAVNTAQVGAGAPLAGDQFGSSSSMHGITAVVGVPGRDSAGMPDSGAAYVYVRSGVSWTEQALLSAGFPGTFDDFGRSVHVDGNTIVVGSPKDTTSQGRTGSAYVFVRSGSQWVEQARLVPSDGTFNDEFGAAVTVFGNTVMVGAPLHDASAPDSGAVYVFERSGTTWTELTKLVGTSGFSQFDNFGSALDLFGDWVAIGASGADVGGLLYIFHGVAGSWTLDVRLQVQVAGGTDIGQAVAVSADRILTGGPDRAFFTTRREGTTWTPLEATFRNETGNDGFGDSVALDGNRALIGAKKRDAHDGAVYVYEHDGANWCYLGKLERGSEPGARFGSSVAAAGGWAIVGAELAGPVGGAAFLSRPLLTFPKTYEAERIVASDSVVNDGFGHSLAASSDTVVVGASRLSPFIPTPGAVYVLSRTGSSWTETAKIAGSSSMASERFGSSLDVDGGTIVVGTVSGLSGAYVYTGGGTSWTQEALLTSTGAADLGTSVSLQGDRIVAGSPSDLNGNAGQGSLYVFERSGTAWTETARIVGETPDDRLGLSVALDEDTVLTSHLFGSQGRAYVFGRSGTSWNREAELLPSPPAPNHSYGLSIDLDGDTAVVGAPFLTPFPPSSYPGAVYVFVRSGTTWSQQARLTPPDGTKKDRFGMSVSLDGDRLLVGASNVDDLFGGAYIFVRHEGEWTLERKLTSCLVRLNPRIGRTVALDGDTAFVGELGVSGTSQLYRFELGDLYPSFCDATDGALTACPCGNPGSMDTGCDIPQGTGGVRLDVLAREISPENRATLVASGYPAASTPTSIVLRGRGLESTPAVFGDGLRCVAAPFVRIRAAFAIGGSATFTLGHGGQIGPHYYQAWFRSEPASACTPGAFNTSNGRSLNW
jgi:hypothetical protein